MYGRYGTDKLGTVMLVAYVVLIFVHTVLSFFIDSVWFDLIIWLVSIALVVTIFYRMFSRNIAKRRRENEKFCGFFKLWRNKIRDRKTHVYRSCPHCGAQIRLPRVAGDHRCDCPKCKERFSVNIK